MKLTAHTIRVKPVSIVQLFAASLLTGLGLLALWAAASDEDARVGRFGSALADALASQVTEPMLARDLIHLGVLANRIVALPEVAGTSIHGIDNEPLALSGDVRRGRSFPAQIVHNDQSIGVVRVVIEPDAFASGAPTAIVMLSILWMIAVPGILLLAARLNHAPRISALRRAALRQPEEHPVTIVPEPLEPETWYLICINLFNQLSLTRDQSTRELALTRSIAARVADLYGGSVQDLPGTGLLLGFGSDESDERPFHVLCAAFMLSRLLADAESFGRYRLALHTLELAPEATLKPNMEPVRDTAVLSALAKDNSIVISNAFYDRLPMSQRLISEPLRHPLLEDLDSTGGGARLALALAEPHDDLIEERLAELDDQPDDVSTARESTF